MNPDITIVIPTVSGREEHLHRAITTYRERTVASAEILVYKDRPGVAYGWQLGAEAASGAYIHMTNDDAEPVQGWDVPARALADHGFQPCPRLINPDGQPWHAPADRDPWTLPDRAVVHMSTMPFLRREWWPSVTPLPPGMHYFADNWISARLQAVGIQSAVCHGYDFVHHWATEHRGAGWTENERMSVDQQYATMAMTIIQRGAAALADST